LQFFAATFMLIEYRRRALMATSWKAVSGAAIVGALAVQSACQPPPAKNITFDVSTLEHRSPIVRLLVIASVEPRFFPDAMFDGFADALTHRLASCGIQSTVLYRDPMAIDFDDRVAAEVQRAAPSALLTMRATGSNVRLTGRRGDGGFIGPLSFDLTMLDAASNATTWRATSTMEVSIGRDWSFRAIAGATFATSIVSRLRDDGVLSGCPAPQAGWPTITPPPGCVQQRQRMLQEAANAYDDGLRAAALQQVPSCGGSAADR
jgi:hypothetical protein